tara:strand:+ start:3072 stop:3281 length:210 start_codon:yes stop_codon:yes gene_type:complete
MGLESTPHKTIGLCSLSYSKSNMNDEQIVAQSFEELRKMIHTDRLTQKEVDRGMKIITTLEKLFRLKEV